MRAITCAFWTEGDRLAAAEPWEDVVEHGAHCLYLELEDLNPATKEWAACWRKEYGFGRTRLELLRSLYTRRLAATELPIRLTPEEWDILTEEGDEGIEDGWELLEAVGILPP